MRLFFVLLVAIILAGVAYYNLAPQGKKTNIANPLSILEDEKKPPESKRSALVQDLEIPWDLVFLPDGDMLVTERPGRILKIGKNRAVIEISGVEHVGEGGLLGIELDPNFKENNFVYIYLTSRENGSLVNRVERYMLDGAALGARKVILGGIRGSSNHDGGKIAFGPDGRLYIGTGDAENTAYSQDIRSLNGKILRINADGTIPDDNPFGNAVYSYGHRNVQGFTWDEDGNLWATEHGRSGLQSGFDELNLIKRGGNYGWPVIEGDETRTGMITPVVNSGASETWAPAGAAYANGSIFFTGLRGRTLYEAVLNGIEVSELKKHLTNEYGRLRGVRLEDSSLYITTSNRDGRGIAGESDDKLIKIPLADL